MRGYAAVIVLASWLAFLPLRLARVRDLLRRPERREPSARLGILLVAVGFAFVWSGVGRRSGALAPAAGALVSVCSAAFGVWAVVTLGRQWTFEAQLRPDHQLVTSGPFRVVRHPVYLAFFGLLIATGLVVARAWWQLVVAVALYLAGTLVRVRAEEQLLRDRFGGAFDVYVRTTPALIPSLGPRRSSQHVP